MTTYQLPDPDIRILVNETLAANHPDLQECGLIVGVLMATNPDGPAIKNGGHPALACVKVVSLKDRVTKGYDVEILIDQHGWDELNAAQKIAVVDHELTHVNRVPNTPKAMKSGEAAWKIDDIGRPKVKLRKGDWMPGDGFSEVVSRHGENAVEFLNISRAMLYANAAKNKNKEE